MIFREQKWLRTLFLSNTMLFKEFPHRCFSSILTNLITTKYFKPLGISSLFINIASRRTLWSKLILINIYKLLDAIKGRATVYYNNYIDDGNNNKTGIFCTLYTFIKF